MGTLLTCPLEVVKTKSTLYLLSAQFCIGALALHGGKVVSQDQHGSC